MKKEEHAATQNEINSDLKIIDLDKLSDEDTIDYDKFSKEDSMNLELKSPTDSYTDATQKSSVWDHVFKINWHLVFLAVLVFSVIFIVYRFKNWGTVVDLDSLGDIDDNYDVEVLDSFMPLIYEGDAAAITDGVTNVVLFGNDALAQNKGTSDDFAIMIEEMTGATVYNCGVTGSFLTSMDYSLGKAETVMDAFTPYWMTTLFTVDNYAIYETLFDTHGDKISAEAMEVYNMLCTIDFNTIDVIGFVYDANDYLKAKSLTNLENPTDVTTYTGNLEASIDLIQDKYPHIRIIVMSPTYAYAINENGDYVSSDMYCYIEDYKLSTYALMLERSASSQGVSFVDNIYGTINETNADQYLLDNINLNIAGRKKLAARFVEALTYYDE